VHAVLGMTLSAGNVDHFPQAFAAAKRELPDLEYRDFHVNIVHESTLHLGNRDLGLRKAVAPEALAAAAEAYRRLRGFGIGPVDYLENAYLRRVERYLATGRTPMRCHALRSSCFVDSWGNVFPCTIYDRKLGSLREVDFELERIWSSPETAAVQREIWDYRCPQCWTPCEAYQSILGNALRPWDSGQGSPSPAALGNEAG
jgi:radical SAM protein with 4Fe4S-binding SPASM domain